METQLRSHFWLKRFWLQQIGCQPIPRTPVFMGFMNTTTTAPHGNSSGSDDWFLEHNLEQLIVVIVLSLLFLPIVGWTLFHAAMKTLFHAFKAAMKPPEEPQENPYPSDRW